ncbi:flippase [Candidatus Pacearchaeota archaeon]|nr:flippase [Candidatus Pacearchaeota archaeon]
MKNKVPVKPSEKDEETNKSLRLIAKTSMIVFIGVMLSRILGYAYRVIVARYFGAETYGLFSLAIMVLGIFSAFASLGLAEGIVRYGAFYRARGENKKLSYILKFTLFYAGIASIIAGIIMFFSAEFIAVKLFHSETLISFLKIFSILIPILVASGIFLSVLRIYEEIKTYSFIYNIFQNFIKVFSLAIFIFIGLKSNAVVYSYFIGATAMLIAAYYACLKKTRDIFIKYNVNNSEKSIISSELLSYSWPLMFSTVIISLFNWIDTFSIGYFMTPSDVGFYNAAVPLALLFYVTSELFTQIFLPLITREFSKNNIKTVKELSKQVGKWIFIINLPFFILVLFFPGAIINLFFGKEYLVAQNCLRILSIGVFTASVARISQNLILMKGKSKVILFDTIIACALNFILNAIMVPRYGITGAASATLISVLFLNLLFIFQAKYYVSILPFRRKMLSIFLVSLIPTAILFYLRSIIQINLFSIIILSSCFFLVYFLLILLISGFDRNDWEIYEAVKRKMIGIRK